MNGPHPPVVIDYTCRWDLRKRISAGALTIVVLLLLTVRFPDSLHAQHIPSVASVYPELEEYLRLARAENPELRSLWNGYQSKLEDIAQVGTLPDPEINLGYTLNPMRPDPYSGRFSISVMQMFPWFGTLKSRESLQEAAAESNLHRLTQRQLQLLQEVQSTWIDLARLDHRIEITKRTAQLIRDLETLVQVRYETARAGQADLLRVQMEEMRLQSTIENLEERVRPIRADFNAYLNREPDHEVTLPSDLQPIRFHPNMVELQAAVYESNPLFDELDSRETMLTRQKELARRQGMPSIGLGLSMTGRNASAMSMFPDSGEMYAAMATIRVPIYRSRTHAQIRQSDALLSSVAHLRSDTENRLHTRLEEALTSYRETSRTLELLTQELIPRAEQAFRILSEEYASGNVGFDELLRLQEQLLDLELEQIDMIADQHKAILQLESLTGGTAPVYQPPDSPDGSNQNDSQADSIRTPIR